MSTTGTIAEFNALVERAQALQSEAERLCDEANENGIENKEFEVRRQADDARAEALAMGAQLLNANGVFRVLDLSTSHLPEVVCDKLNSYDGVIAHKLKHGWLLWVPADLAERRADYPKSIPTPVWQIWEHAKKLGCSYVLIDADADTVDGLKTWQW